MASPITAADATMSGTEVVDVINGLAARRRWPTVVSATTTYTVLTDDSYIVRCDATGAAFTVNLPAVSGLSGLQVTIKKTDSSANAVTVDGSGAETIDGAATYSLATQYKHVTLVCNGTSWDIIGSN